MNGAKIVLECLKKEGVKQMFGIPGGSNLLFYDELQSQSDIRHILMRHEQGAAHAAEGFARASGKTGVCSSTSGPGATNLVTGLADAYLDSVPMVAFSGQVQTDLIGSDAFQEADMFGLTMAITKHNFKILDVKELAPSIKSAFEIANSGRKGPVHVDLPKDIFSGETEFSYEKSAIALKPLPSFAKNEEVLNAAEIFLSAERPIILAGGGVVSSNACGELVWLAEHLFSFVANTIMAKGCIPEGHSLSLGQLGMHGRQAANYAVENCDALLAIGVRFSDRITGDVKTFAPDAKVVHVDIDASEMGKNVKAYLPIIADAKCFLSQLSKEILRRQAKGKENEWTKRIKLLKEACNCERDSDFPISPQMVMSALNESLPENTIITTEVGRHQMYATHFLKVSDPRNFMTSSGLGTMGFGFPAALGAKVAVPNKPVIDVAGDGSILMVCQEFATSIEENIPVAACVLKDGWLGMVRHWQKLFFGSRFSATNLGKQPDFVKLSEAFGGKGIRVERVSELNEAIRSAISSETLFVIEVAVANEDSEERMLPTVPPRGRNTKMLCGKQCAHVQKMLG